ncbi:MAG TPA: hypothetical protein VGO57_04845 [Verrucomicrobiae bacterium]|jgi:tetratricopeptide (TPR) repeat protein
MQFFHQGAICLWVFLLVTGAWSSYGQATNADYALGIKQYNQEDWSGAITNFSKAIVAAYDLDQSYSYRAYARSKLNDSAGALADCAEFIKLNPKSSGNYFWRAWIYVNLTNYAAALADYITAIRLNPRAKDTDLASAIGSELARQANICFATNDLSGAISNLNVVVFLNPINSFPYLRRAQFKLFQGRYGAAIADADISLKYDHGYYMAWVVRAWSRVALNEAHGASEDYDKVNAWLDERLARKKSDPEAWQEERMLADILSCLIKGETQAASEKLENLKKFSLPNGEDKIYTQIYREHWQKLIETIIAKTKEKKN